MTYRVITVCTGNICRSPMAEYVLRDAVQQAGLADRVEVSSVGTTSWEEGEPVDPRAGAVLAAHGLDASAHRARHMSAADLREADLVLALDQDHVAPLRRIAGPARDRIHLLREFDPEAGADLGIRDPWYGDAADFDLTWDLVQAAAPGVIDHVRRAVSEDRPESGTQDRTEGARS